MPLTLPPENTPPHRFVGTTEVLADVFSDGVRPSVEWLRKQASAGNIRAMKIGRRFVFDPAHLRADLMERFQNTSRPVS